RITLKVSRRSTFAYSLDATPRVDLASPPTTLRKNQDKSSLLVTGGSSAMLISGSAQLIVVGNALVNSTYRDAINIKGTGSYLNVCSSLPVDPIPCTGLGGSPKPGLLGIRLGGECLGCIDKANVVPFKFDNDLVDPLLYLPAPDEATMSAWTQATGCVRSGTVTTCQPGVYDDLVAFQAGQAVEFKEGVYVFHAGLSISSNRKGSITGKRVSMFIGCGRNAPPSCATTAASATFQLSGQAEVQLSPPISGPYACILLYQSRTNTNTAQLGGGANLGVADGVIYVPNANFVMQAGSSALRLGAVVARSVELAGNGEPVSIEGWDAGLADSSCAQ
ncbi:MAG: hypothetical protein ACKOYM_05645, partial [Actinomycetes bacterium]